jgi:putative pyruvate formate lyase activating enzyme
MKELDFRQELKNCKICPHNCGANRLESARGSFCNTDALYNIASITLHRGEEPAVNGENGVCNIFFTHCNMQCIYCQNYQISKNSQTNLVHKMDKETVLAKIIDCLAKNNTNRVGFVSPSHNLMQVIELASALKEIDDEVVTIYNTNSYEKAEYITRLQGLIDIFLPDFKYYFNSLGLKYSKVRNYFDYAATYIDAMIKLAGNPVFDENGFMKSGVIIRHLILPGEVKNSIKVLEYIAGKWGNKVFLSLMAQYYPVLKVKYDNLNRKITEEEYNIVVDKVIELGFENGWVQELESAENYLPDFEREVPFE